jgi:hypothetical protein
MLIDIETREMLRNYEFIHFTPHSKERESQEGKGQWGVDKREEAALGYSRLPTYLVR